MAPNTMLRSCGWRASAGASLLAMCLLCCLAAGVAAQGDIAAVAVTSAGTSSMRATTSRTSTLQLHLCAYITGNNCGAGGSALRTQLPTEVRAIATSLGISRSSDLVLYGWPLLQKVRAQKNAQYSILLNVHALRCPYTVATRQLAWPWLYTKHHHYHHHQPNTANACYHSLLSGLWHASMLYCYHFRTTWCSISTPNSCPASSLPCQLAIHSPPPSIA